MNVHGSYVHGIQNTRLPIRAALIKLDIGKSVPHDQMGNSSSVSLNFFFFFFFVVGCCFVQKTSFVLDRQ